MPAIADQVATIEHDLSIAQTLVDSLRSENAQLKNALAALNVDHGALQAQHADALALVDETRQHADGVASAALMMLKVSRRSIGTVASSEASEALRAQYPWKNTSVNLPAPPASEVAAMQAKMAKHEQQMKSELDTKLFGDAQNEAAVAAALEPEKTDVRPELPVADQGFSPEMQNALHADAEKLSQITGEDHSVTFLADEPPMTNAERFRAHMPGEDPLPIFLKPRALPENVLG